MVNTRQGLTFASILRALLRQDPDVILIGEIRDAETAKIAVQAAQTGHLVLSSLHTNNCLDTLKRLHSLGVNPLDIRSSLKLIVSQRLLPVAERHNQTEKNRQAVFEVVPWLDDSEELVEKLISSQASIKDLRQQCREGAFQLCRVLITAGSGRLIMRPGWFMQTHFCRRNSCYRNIISVVQK